MRWYSIYELCKTYAVQLMASGDLKSISNAISTRELSQLLKQLTEVSNIRFRCREKSGSWPANHMYVTAINADDSIILYDDNNSKRHKVRIQNILQFDLDSEFKNFKANKPYNVKFADHKELVK